MFYQLLFFIYYITAKVFSSFDVDEGEVEDAVNYYISAGSRELGKIRDDIRTMYEGFGGE